MMKWKFTEAEIQMFIYMMTEAQHDFLEIEEKRLRDKVHHAKSEEYRSIAVRELLQVKRMIALCKVVEKMFRVDPSVQE